MREIHDHSKKMNTYEEKNSTHQLNRKALYSSLSRNETQFKRERIDAKVGKVIRTIPNTPDSNVYERRVGQTLTPRLLEGKIQYGKLLKDPIFDSVRAEVIARSITFPPDINWRDLIKLLMNNEGGPKFFTPVTNYDNFKWNDSHFPI